MRLKETGAAQLCTVYTYSIWAAKMLCATHFFKIDCSNNQRKYMSNRSKIKKYTTCLDFGCCIARKRQPTLISRRRRYLRVTWVSAHKAILQAVSAQRCRPIQQVREAWRQHSIYLCVFHQLCHRVASSDTDTDLCAVKIISYHRVVWAARRNLVRCRDLVTSKWLPEITYTVCFAIMITVSHLMTWWPLSCKL